MAASQISHGNAHMTYINALCCVMPILRPREHLLFIHLE
jgi:hypothetical protein